MRDDDGDETAPLNSPPKEDVSEAGIDPDVIGDLDYPEAPSNWECCCGCCCCCCCCLPKCLKPRKMGAAYVFCETQDADGTPRVKCMLGAGWAFSIMTYLIMFGIPIAAYFFSLPRLHWIYSVIAYVVTLVGFIALARTSFGDPGIFPRYAAPKDGRWRYLARTNSYRPPGIIFCSENAFLVEEMDHFCPWTGTTIAKKNLPFFHNFLCMLMTGLVYAMVVVAVAMGNSQSIYLRGARHTGTQAEHCAMCQITTSEGNVCNEITHLNPTIKGDAYGSVSLQCNRGSVITEISFANWGLPEGQCGTYRAGTCGVDASEWARKQCEGNQSCKLSPNHQKELGDPCYGIHKQFKIMATCTATDKPSIFVHIWPILIVGMTVAILAFAFVAFF